MSCISRSIPTLSSSRLTSAQGYISESQCNLILQHHDSSVFQRSYLSRYITADTQAAYRDLKPQTALMRVASGMSRTIDTRRPRNLTLAHQARVDCHPEVKLLRRAKTKLKQFIRDTYGTVISMKGTPIHDRYKMPVTIIARTDEDTRRLSLKMLRKNSRSNP